MAHDLQLDLDIVLPEAHDHSDRCVSELLAVLAATDGITDVHIHPPSGTGPAQLCFNAEPGRLSLARLADRARSAGTEISQRYGHAIWRVKGISHATRADNAAATLRRLPGVLDANVATGGAARIEFDRSVTDEPTLVNGANAAGLRVVRSSTRTQTIGRDSHTDRSDHDHSDKHTHSTHSHEDHTHHGHGHGGHAGHSHGGNAELLVAAVAFGVFLIARILDWTSDLDTLVTSLYVATALVTGVMVGRDVLGTLRARRFDIEMLMLAAAAGAGALGDWSDAALLLVLFSLGHGLEGFAMARARREIESLADLAPSSAHRVGTDGTTAEVAVESIMIGDVLVIKPNERIPADGLVIKGATSVDESPVTGESTPVDKQALPPGTDVDFESALRSNRVFSGTLNGTHAIEIRVARAASDSTLARVVQLVSEAETQVSPTQRRTQQIVRVFVPMVLVLVTVLLVIPLLLGSEFRPTFMRAMAVLVASSPCALAIATPSAVLSGIARAARDGVLVKGGGPLETLGQVCTIAFDKTGTLTEGRPKLVSVIPATGSTIENLLGVAVAVESQSDHPLAHAVTTGAHDFVSSVPSLNATQVHAEVGRGVTAMIDGQAVGIGTRTLLNSAELTTELSSELDRLESGGNTTMIVTMDGNVLGILGVMDTPRPDAPATVERLTELGIHHTIMLSGDHQAVADAVGKQVGITETRGGLLPEDKVEAIRQLLVEHEHGVAMVGDGVNDAPALASSSVGIAMGAAGSAVALETADIALMGNSLDRLPFAVQLARRSSAVIKQNLFMSLGMVAILIPLTILGVGIGPAVIAHEGSTLVVVANALRLLAHRGDSKA